jgi:cytochrome P450
MTTAVSEVPTFDVTFTEPGFNQDPYPVLEQIRALGPVVYNPAQQKLMVTGYRDSARVLGNVRRFDSSGLVEYFRSSFGGITMEALDSDRHHLVRAIWSEQFERQALHRQRGLITEVVDSQLVEFAARVRDGETLDAIPEMIRNIPTLVIAHLLGIEPDMFAEFSAWSDAIGDISESIFDTSPAAAALVSKGVAATAALNEYIAEQVRRRRGRGGDDLISVMVESDYGRTGMELSEIVASNTQLVFAGNETTAKLMASTIVALAQHPDQRRALAADRSLIPAAFEETHRWQTLVQVGFRWAVTDEASLVGVPVTAGTEVMVLAGAANRDPNRWERPAEFDIRRPGLQHLGFGFGMHVCLGLNLARLEAEIWLNRLMDLLPDFELAEDEVDYGLNFILRGPVAVPLRSS